MSDRSKIEWTEATWNPVRGCSRVSEGCRHCYAERHAARFSGAGLPFEGFAVVGSQGPHWTGRVELMLDKLAVPLRWRRPRLVFVNSMSDLFHEALSDRDIVAVFAIMAGSPRHTFQVLTKRPQRMRDVLQWLGGDSVGAALSREEAFRQALAHHGLPLPGWLDVTLPRWPLPNVWLGVSVEDQAAADARVPLLLDTPAAVRFVSAEPLLGPVDLDGPGVDDLHALGCGGDGGEPCPCPHASGGQCRGLDWVIVGGESGPGARPMHPDWARSLRDQCAEEGVAYFFKQWGAWAPLWDPIDDGREHPVVALDGVKMARYGKHAAGCLLDGREHHAMPGRVSTLAPTAVPA